MSNLTPFEQLVGVPILRLHDKIYQKTNGRIGHRIPGVPPSLLLHTVGAKTGRPRTTSLTYARDGDSYLIVASNGGDERHPGWYHNLRKHPECEINVGPKRFARGGAAGRPGRLRLPAAVAARQQEQREPVHRLSEADVAAHPDLRADAGLTLKEPQRFILLSAVKLLLFTAKRRIGWSGYETLDGKSVAAVRAACAHRLARRRRDTVSRQCWS